ncbi:hypothetical protein CEN39_16660 [Fischerella thermalis CCMEE 5201]|jgi:hypothetical protein|nr:hypothetical protein CEN39_16660 [Fischerella thermalis CCMEE 5201]
MATESKHIIRSLIFDISVPTQEEAIAIQSFLSNFAEQFVPAILTEAIAPYDHIDTIIYIDRLEIDLGTLQLDNLELQFRKQLTEKLAKHLPKTLKIFNNLPVNLTQSPRTICFMEQWQHFLINGNLPWNADREAFQDMDSMVIDWINTERPTFKQLLRQIIPNDNARKRLIFNLQEDTLIIILNTYLSINIPDCQTLKSVINWLSEYLKQLAIIPNQKKLIFEACLHEITAIESITIEVLFQKWLEKELHPYRFYSREHWIAFWKLVTAEISISYPRESIVLKRILVRYMEVIAPQIMQISPESNIANSIDKKESQTVDASFVNTGELKTCEIYPFDRRKNENYQALSPNANETSWFIQNSGLVLLYPYLKRYLETLNLVKDNQFFSKTHQLQAIHELEFLVRGNQPYREYDLVLNKVLCGIPLFEPIDIEFQCENFAETEAEKLLQSAIRNWTIIKNTSVDGFRRSFLMREGKLIQKENSWTLICDRKGYDVLLERLPYPIYVVKLTWMDRPLYVEW